MNKNEVIYQYHLGKKLLDIDKSYFGGLLISSSEMVSSCSPSVVLLANYLLQQAAISFAYDQQKTLPALKTLITY